MADRMTEQAAIPRRQPNDTHLVVRVFYYLLIIPLFLLLVGTVVLAWYGVFRYLHQEGFFTWLMTLNGSAPFP